MKAIESKNKKWGFYGTTVSNRKLKIEREWPAAFAWVHQAVPTWTAATIRDFLDSTFGRHLADEAHDAKGIANVDPERWLRSMLEFAEEVGKDKELAGLQERLQATRAVKKAEDEMRKAAAQLAHVLDVLPAEGKGSVIQENIRAYVNDRLEMIRAYFGEIE